MFMHIFITCMILTSCFVHLVWFELFILWHVFFTLCWFGMHATQFVITLTIIIKLIKTLRASLMLSGRRIHLQCRRQAFNSWVRKIPWGRKWQPAPVFFRRKSHGQRNLVGYSPWGCKESDTTEWLTTQHNKNIKSVFYKWQSQEWKNMIFFSLKLFLLHFKMWKMRNLVMMRGYDAIWGHDDYI